MEEKMNNKPLVSIIIPVYNGSNYLAESIESALNQDYENKEIIVVNDGSRDEGATREVALRYQDRIRYFEKSNGGCASALNYGIKMMTGEWFSWLSHDDLYSPKKLSLCIECATQNNLLENGGYIINGAAELIDEKGNAIFHPIKRRIGKDSGEKLFKNMLFESSIYGCALLIHRNDIEKVGLFDESLTYIPDFDYWVRAGINNIGLISIDEYLCKARVHTNQVSVRAKSKQIPEMKKELKKFGDELAEKGKFYMIIDLWIYAYSRGYREEEKYLRNILDSNKVKIEGYLSIARKNRLKFVFEKTIKNIYRQIFKHGID